MKAKYCGSCMIPEQGSIGEVFEAEGFSDYGSVEQGAYMFVPDDDQESAYYVDRSDFEYLS